jgi:hypothetical protein
MGYSVMLPPGCRFGGWGVKEQYVGDVSDYRKYALLRLLGRSRLSIGVCWMLTPGDGRSDGNKLGYLDQPQFQKHDPELLTLLRRVKDEPDSRRLVLIEESGIIPRATYVNTLVPDGLAARQFWFKQAMASLAGSELVFFDPDNGLDVLSKAKGTKNSSKFLYRDEVVSTVAAGHSVLIYQHFPREERASFVARLAEDLKAIGPTAEIWAFRTSHVVFLLIIQPRHMTALSAAARHVAEQADPTFLKAELIVHAGA